MGAGGVDEEARSRAVRSSEVGGKAGGVDEGGTRRSRGSSDGGGEAGGVDEEARQGSKRGRRDWIQCPRRWSKRGMSSVIVYSVYVEIQVLDNCNNSYSFREDKESQHRLMSVA